MANVTAAKRAKKKANHRAALLEAGNPHPEHIQRVDPQHPTGSPLPVRCPVCSPRKQSHALS